MTDHTQKFSSSRRSGRQNDQCLLFLHLHSLLLCFMEVNRNQILISPAFIITASLRNRNTFFNFIEMFTPRIFRFFCTFPFGYVIMRKNFTKKGSN